MEIGGVTVPWWVYGIIAVIIVIILYAFYLKITAYTPQSTAFQTTETALPAGFDAAGEAAYADSVFNETFGGDDGALVTRLAALSDNELIAVSNSFNSAYYTSDKGSLLTLLSGLDFTFSSSVPRNNLVSRMTNLSIT